MRRRSPRLRFEMTFRADFIRMLPIISRSPADAFRLSTWDAVISVFFPVSPFLSPEQLKRCSYMLALSTSLLQVRLGLICSLFAGDYPCTFSFPASPAGVSPPFCPSSFSGYYRDQVVPVPLRIQVSFSLGKPFLHAHLRPFLPPPFQRSVRVI